MSFTKEIKAKWIARLRDPNSIQCTNKLYASIVDTSSGCVNRSILETAGACCLGHLCIVAQPELKDPPDVIDIWTVNAKAYGFISSVLTVQQRRMFVHMNDDLGNSLPEIADVVATLPTDGHYHHHSQRSKGATLRKRNGIARS